MQARSFLLQGAPLCRTKCFKTRVGNGDAFLMAQDDIYAFHPARWLQPWQAPSLARPFNAVNRLAAGYFFLFASLLQPVECSQSTRPQFFFSLLFLLAQLMHRDLNSSLSDGQRHITECLLTSYTTAIYYTSPYAHAPYYNKRGKQAENWKHMFMIARLS